MSTSLLRFLSFKVCREELFHFLQTDKILPNEPLVNKAILQRAARSNNFETIKMDLTPDQAGSTESSPSPARPSKYQAKLFFDCVTKVVASS